MVFVTKIWQTAHSNLVRILCFGHLNVGSRFYYMGMGLCQLSLADYMCGGKIPSLEASTGQPEGICHIMENIVSGLALIHRHGRIHLRLTPQKW
jgi:hypothetical protein